MTGYREQRFDPNGVDGSPPLPFTATQWFGAVLVVLGALAIVVSLLGRLGVTPKFLDDPIPFVALAPVGAALLNARRRTSPFDPQVLRTRRIMAIVLALAVAIGAAVLAFLLARGS